MTTLFPTSLDNLDATRGTATDTLAVPSHVTHHTNEDDAIEALQAKVGVDSSAVTTSLDYKLKNPASVNPGHKHTLTATGFTDVVVTAPSNGEILTWDTDHWENAGTSAADASTTVKGVTKVSVAPASASDPIAVGDNDPRVPTTGENDALVGTSGTPSSSNKYVTADDVSSAAGSGKIVRASGTALPALDAGSLTNIPTAVISYDTTQASIGASSTAEETVYSVAIPANTLGTSRVVDIRTIASQLTIINTATATIRFKYGSTTVATVVINPGATRDYVSILGQMFLGSAGTTGTQKFNVVLHGGISETANVIYATGDGTASEDSTTALNFIITIQYSASDANNRWIKRLLVAKRT
ncbi:hypothetical protein [Bradyrhizobium sp. AUGA SZCCT0431]|uniref:hypothetical protein n=1 Tax=Bradyrhizobium sp. AUGA SZCCT0431 TaxID=2807674 RepID=UPI001BA995CD|nr:hypothetical protein [Bradyrhizobium sp. AUGA SZCCT0431]MBR1146677.1 hypothetical protein [Bradyrhizobium sp. AUGA SZCCT0431]